MGFFLSCSGYAADDITHCIRPQDVVQRRAVIILRRYLPFCENAIFLIKILKNLYINDNKRMGMIATYNAFYFLKSFS